MSDNTTPYFILPFRFSRFGKGEIIIVNEAGEFYFIKSNDFERFINHELSTNEPIFLDLKGKQFLTNTDIPLAINMLATKYRTKKGFLRHFTTLHMMVITYRCNHNCKYCQVSSDDIGSYDMDMSISTVRKVVDLIFKSPSPRIKIEFQGGEPLLNWDAVKETIEYAEKLNITQKKELEFVICTNLTLIDEEKLNFIKDHHAYISTSLDGPQYLHDQNRILRSGKSSYTLFQEKLKLTKEKIGMDKVSALMTTSRYSLQHLREVIDEYIRLGFSGIFIRSLNPYGLANINQNELGYDVEDFTSSYNDALDYIIKLNLDGFHFTEYYSTLLMSRILTPFSTGFVDLQSPSGAGICGVIYDYNGDVFPADEARMLARMGDRKFIMGNVHRDNYIDIFDNPMLKELVDKSCVETMPGCASCAFQLYCGADPIRNYVENGDIVGHRPTSEFCKKNLLLIESLFKKIREKDKDVLDVFWSWMTKRSLEDLRCENIQRSSH